MLFRSHHANIDPFQEEQTDDNQFDIENVTDHISLEDPAGSFVDIGEDDTETENDSPNEQDSDMDGDVDRKESYDNDSE